MKTKITIVILALLSTINVVFGSTNTGKTGALLWKISGNGLESPSYILGTFHLKPAEFLNSIPGAMAALSSVEQVIGELTMNDMAGMQLQMQQAMMMPADVTYEMLYSEDDFDTVDQHLTALIGTGLNQLAMMKPAAISLIYTMVMYQKYFPNLNPADKIDIAVQNFAMENNKSILGLESIDDQLKALFGASLERQAELLLCGLQNQEYSISQIEFLIEYYSRADLDKLGAMMLSDDDPCPSSQEETEKLNKNRNNNWIQILPGMIGGKSSFIAVGALHLAGEEGLLNQLEKLGYKVEPVQ